MSGAAETAERPDAGTIPALDGVVRRDGAGWSQRLFGYRCRECGAVSLSPGRYCPSCWSYNSQDEQALSEKGVLYSYTVVHHAPPGYDAPYAIAYVDLPEGVRLMAQAGADLVRRLSPGDTVLLAVGPVGREEDEAVIVGPVLREKIATGGRP